ncbi:MAG: DUF177 domain-containing protein [Rhodothermia bacterium]
MVQIDVSTMSAGIHEVVLYSSPNDLDLSEEEFGAIEVQVRLDIGDQQILAQLEVSADSRLICDRTLAPFTQTVKGQFTIVFTRKARDSGDAGGTVKYLDPAARELDVTAELRDTILLAVPLRKVAPEAAETELVLKYGDDAVGVSTDPRWEALKKLKSDGVV